LSLDDLHEHIVILAADAPNVNDILSRIDLNQDHEHVTYVYNNSAFRGFSAHMNASAVQGLGLMADTLYVEKSISSAADHAPDEGIQGHLGSPTSFAQVKAGVRESALPQGNNSSRPILMQRRGVPWGLERISSFHPETFDRHVDSIDDRAFNFTYTYTDRDGVSLGRGVDIYIVDSGIYTKHPAFGNRATMGWSCYPSIEDETGHGTHVAGIAAGDVVGVASRANIIGVKVFSKPGPDEYKTGCVMAGIDYIVRQHDARSGDDREAKGEDSKFAGSVVNLSLGGYEPPAAVEMWHTVLRMAVDRGIHFAISAGNEVKDACEMSPSQFGGISDAGTITVGAINISGRLWKGAVKGSNYGPCVDVYAPGQNIISAYPPPPFRNSTGDLLPLGGTSMAAPHLAGVMACLMADDPQLAKHPRLQKKRIVEMAFKTTKFAGMAHSYSMEQLNNGMAEDQGV